MSETHTRTRDQVLVDVVRQSPVDHHLERGRRRRLVLALLVALAVAALVALS
jgi:hypothetical protein